MLFQTSLGIDMGEDILSVVCLRASLKGFRSAVQAEFPLDKEMLLEEKVSMGGQFVSDFLKENRIVPTMVFLGIPRSGVVLRYISLPVALKENLRETLGYEMEKYVPFSPEDIHFDFQIIHEDRETAMMRLLLVAVQKETVSFFLSMVEEMGAGISGIEIGATAAANYFAGRSGENGVHGLAFVLSHDAGFEVGLLREGFLDYSKGVRLSSKDAGLPERIADELNLLKRRMGDGERALNVVLCFPEGEALAKRLNGDGRHDVRPADLSLNGLASCGVVPAYGLALKAFQKPLTDINLLPPKLRKRVGRAGYYVMFCLGVLLVLSVIAWGGGNVLKYRLALDRLNAELKTLGVAMADIDRDRATCDQLQDRISALNALGAGPSVLAVLRELSERIPESAWVSGFTFSEKGVELNGEADSASELIPLLDASPVFRDVVFLSTITKTRDGQDRFRIGLKFN